MASSCHNPSLDRPQPHGTRASVPLVDVSNLPKHIGIIMDGNGRWAQSHDEPRTYGHREGSDAVRRIIHLYGVKPGSRAVVMTANPEGDATIGDLERAGIEVARVVDARQDQYVVEATGSAKSVEAVTVSDGSTHSSCFIFRTSSTSIWIRVVNTGPLLLSRVSVPTFSSSVVSRLWSRSRSHSPLR